MTTKADIGKKENKKEQLILESAKALFWKHGFKRVTIEEICIKAKVSKMTFYRFYPNKVELVKVLFRKSINESVAIFREIMNEDVPADKKIEKMIRMKLEGTHDMSQEFITDIYNDNQFGLTTFLQDETKKMWSELVNDFKIAQNKGFFRKDFKPELLFYLVQKMNEMMSDPRITNLYTTPHDFIMEITRLFFYGIAPYNKDLKYK